MSVPDLTPREAQALKWIMKWMSQFGTYPDAQFLARKMGLSPTTMPQYFWRLGKKGYIEKAPHDSMITVLRDPKGNPVRQVNRITFERGSMLGDPEVSNAHI